VVTGPEPARERSRRPTRKKITLSLATAMAVVALVVGVVLGYVARGGPPERLLVTTEQDIPVLTVTAPEETAP